MGLTREEYEERIHRAHVGSDITRTILRYLVRDLCDLRDMVIRLESERERARLNEPKYETKVAADGAGIFTREIPPPCGQYRGENDDYETT